MRRRASGLLAGLLALAGCSQDQAATADATPPSSAPADPGPPDPPGTADPEPGRGLAETLALAMRGGGEVRGLDLILAGAVVVGGVDVATLVKLPIWGSLQTSLPSRERGFLEAGSTCGVPPQTWKSFVIGTDPVTRDMAMVATATGLGKAQTLQCLSASLGFALQPDAKRMSDHTGGGIVLDDDSIAFATNGWMPLLEERVAGQGSKLADGKLAAVLARVDQSKALWFAGALPEDAQSTARMVLQANVHDVAGWADLAAGVKVHLSLAVDDGKGVRERLHEQWMSAKSMATSSGVPQGVADSVVFADKDDVVTIELAATEAEVRTITDMVMRAMGI